MSTEKKLLALPRIKKIQKIQGQDKIIGGIRVIAWLLRKRAKVQKSGFNIKKVIRKSADNECPLFDLNFE